jgi:hypothetical protein
MMIREKMIKIYFKVNDIVEEHHNKLLQNCEHCDQTTAPLTTIKAYCYT